MTNTAGIIIITITTTTTTITIAITITITKLLSAVSYCTCTSTDPYSYRLCIFMTSGCISHLLVTHRVFAACSPIGSYPQALAGRHPPLKPHPRQKFWMTYESTIACNNQDNKANTCSNPKYNPSIRLLAPSPPSR